MKVVNIESAPTDFKIPAVPGLKVKGQVLEFDDTFSESDITELLKSVSGVAERQVKTKAFTPSENDYDRVKSFTKAEGDVEQFGYYETVASSTTIDAQRDKFDTPLLRAMADQYTEGRTVVFQHRGGMGIGKTYSGEVIANEKNGHDLIVKFYVHDQAMLPTGKAKALIDSGIYDRVSVAVRANATEYVDSEKSPDGRGFFLYGSGEGALVKELTLTDMGVNQDAILKAEKSSFSDRVTFTQIEEKSNPKAMELEKVIVKSLGGDEIETTKAGKDAITALESKIEGMSTELKSFKDKEEAKMNSLREDYLAKSLQANPDASEDVKKGFEARASVFTEIILNQEIEILDKKIKALKSKSMLNPGKKEGNENEDKTIASTWDQ